MTTYKLTLENLEAAFRRAVRRHERIANPPARVKFPGITTAAENLGVERTHLYRVLTGERGSRRLLAAWERLQREGKVG